MLKKHITLCEFNYYPHMLPLVSGYLKAYAQKDSEVAANCEFELYTRQANTPAAEILDDLVSRQSDVYAMSCYIWNMGLIKQIMEPLLERVPHARIILGGPQVQGRITAYADPGQDRVFIANGEGETIFYEFLQEVLSGDNNFNRRPGLNFWNRGLETTTPSPSLIKDLDDIPSPFLNGSFGDMPFINVAYETNRGCPYTCSFCYFSRGGEYRKLRKFSRDRIEDELKWLTSRDLMYLFLADANWGVFKEDIEISRMLAGMAKDQGSPTFVYFSSAKNRPNNVFEIAKIFKEAGISSAQPVSFQSLNPEVLKLISRINIKPDKIEEMQGLFENDDIDSYVEMIWPLPGETLESFIDGLESLCGQQLGAINCYPLILLPNTELWDREEEFGFVSVQPEDDLSESKLVVKTNWVSEEECKAGIRFFFATHILFNIGTLRTLMSYLHEEKGIRRREVLRAFSDYLHASPDNSLAHWVEEFAIEKGGFYDNTSMGLCAHRVLFTEREQFQEFLYGFLKAQSWWNDEEVRLLFEMDLINTPFLYSTPPEFGPDKLAHRVGLIEITATEDATRIKARIPEDYRQLVSRYIQIDAAAGMSVNEGLYEISYVADQLPHMPSWGKEQVGNYGLGRVQSNRSLMPRWTQTEAVDEGFIEAVI